MVRDNQSQELVKEGLPTDCGYKHNGTINLKKNAKRPGFVKSMGHKVNDERFTKTDFYDKSAFLSNNLRTKHVLPFQTYSKR